MRSYYQRSTAHSSASPIRQARHGTCVPRWRGGARTAGEVARTAARVRASARGLQLFEVVAREAEGAGVLADSSYRAFLESRRPARFDLQRDGDLAAVQRGEMR